METPAYEMNMTANDQSMDAVFEALADGHRREIVSYLMETSESDVDELATVLARRGLADRETGGSSIAARLYHVHLPKLDAANLVDYEPDAGEVEYVGGSEVADLLATALRQPIPE